MMKTAKEKLDFLIKEVKTLQPNQLKVHTAVEGLTKWSSDGDKIVVDLSNDIKSLTSPIAALEALSSAPTLEAPPREEGGGLKATASTTVTRVMMWGHRSPITPWSRVSKPTPVLLLH
jgi:hypothetical protein